MNEPLSGADDAGDASETFRRSAGSLLRAAAEDLDASTASRLNRARQNALREFPRRSAYWPVPWPAPWRLPAIAPPAVAMVAVAVLTVALWPSQQSAPPPATSAADMDLLLTADSLEMVEDLEFYAWLDADLSVDQLGAELESAT